MYTLHLQDAKWSNGEPMTAKGFGYAWKRAVDLNFGVEYTYIMFDIKNTQKQPYVKNVYKHTFDGNYSYK
ncbi:ABC transporter substrate-binding protein [Ectobacillus panaciterrae]|uniref:ABC transporter substrate-binding protein n=1 Tax=Ectobacillus panaciterrae TaxID=363872 RepID=UPI0012DC827D|nr:ABC transporter substrate-binding protein [Ectobacillus panaciterrae]